MSLAFNCSLNTFVADGRLTASELVAAVAVGLVFGFGGKAGFDASRLSAVDGEGDDADSFGFAAVAGLFALVVLLLSRDAPTLPSGREAFCKNLSKLSSRLQIANTAFHFHENRSGERHYGNPTNIFRCISA
jgi:hypothetical protein